jgi:hypothetical protein
MANAKKLTLVESKPDDYTYLLIPCQGFFRSFCEKVNDRSGAKSGNRVKSGSRLT